MSRSQSPVGSWSDDDHHVGVVEKVERPLYTVSKRSDGTVELACKGQFSELTDEIRQFTRTQRLVVTSEALKSLPVGIREFRDVKYLKIGLPEQLAMGEWDVWLREIPGYVEEMKKLEELEVWAKKAISEIPEGICVGLTLLRRLIIRACGLTSLPHNMGQLTKLEELDLSFNDLKHLCHSFSLLVNLKTLNLSFNPFVSLQDELPLSSLTNIIELSLWNVRLSALPPDVHHLSELKVLNIVANSISRLPKQLCDLHKLTDLDADFNPLVSPPLEVCVGGMSAVRAYFHALTSSLPAKRQRMKGLVSGSCKAGKTSLSRTLETGQSSCTADADRTVGIEEHQLRLSDGFRLKIIDCGGHRSYLLTNQLLVSDKSVNLVVIDYSEYELSDEYFREHAGHYIQMILERCREAIVLSVFTKVDQLRTDGDRSAVREHYETCVREMLEERREEMKQRGLRSGRDSRLSFLVHQNVDVRGEPLFVSSRTLEGMQQLYERLEDITHNDTLLPRLEAIVPETWAAFEDRLEYSAQFALGNKKKPIIAKHGRVELRSLKSVVDIGSPIPVWSVESVKAYGLRCGVSEGETELVLPYLHQVSSILYFPQYPSLRHTVFGLVSFVVDVLKPVFRHDHDNLQYDIRFRRHPNAVSHEKFQEMKMELVNNACVSMPMLMALWSDFQLEARHLDAFISMLIEFDFAYILACPDVRQTAIRMLQDTPCFQDEEGPDEEESEGDPLSASSETHSALSVSTDEMPVSGSAVPLSKSVVDYLMSRNGKLLLPWLLADKRPDKSSRWWPTDCESSSLQVIAKFSFVYSVPRGVFERLSSRCHRHSSYIHHWRSGLLIRYGCVTLLAVADDNSREVTMTARAPRSEFNLFRLFHVLWRCVSEMENIVVTIPGVLLDRYITTKKDMQSAKATYRVPPSGLHFNVDNVSEMQKALENPPSHGIQSVVSSVHEGIPLTDVFSTDGGSLVSQDDVKLVARGAANQWKSLAIELDVDPVEVPKTGLDRQECQNMLQKWVETSGANAMICVLSDALHACGLQSVADKHFGHILDTLRPHTDTPSSLGQQAGEKAQTASSCPPGTVGSQAPADHTAGPLREGGAVAGSEPANQLPAVECSQSTKADNKVNGKELVEVARKLASKWDELASLLSPELFTMEEIAVIRQQHQCNPFSQARQMLETWSNHFDKKATRRLLIEALCEMNHGSQAAKIFGDELVEFVLKSQQENK